MKLEVQIRSKYGRDLIYPINGTADKFAELLGKKTLSPADLKIIKALGYEVQWVLKSLDIDDLL